MQKSINKELKKEIPKKPPLKKTRPENVLKTRHSGKQFWSNILVKLQNLGKALLFPIAVLPFAALLNRFGSLAIQLHPTGADGSRDAANWIGFIIQTPGKLIFDNLALIFAIGTAFGLSKDNRGEAALVGAVLYLILSAFLAEYGLAFLFYKNVLQMEYYTNPSKDEVTWIANTGFSKLFYVPTYGQILLDPLDPTSKALKPTGASYVLNIGVIGGITAGCLSAWLYNKFRDIRLPMALSFFGGRRFVPMMVMLISLPVAFLFAVIWPWIQYGLMQFGQTISSGDAWAVPGAFLYGFINRLLQPFGLHHILNTFLWFQLPIEGNIVDMSGHIVLGSDIVTSSDAWNNADPTLINQLNNLSTSWAQRPTGGITADNYTNYFSYMPTLLDTNPAGQILAMGDGKYAVFGDINAFQKALVSGTFQTGYFPMYWGGLPAAALAMILTAKKENRKQVAAFLGGVGLVAVLTGIDEPIVFAFIFVGPILWFYNALFTAIFCAIGIAMHMHIGFGFSGGLIDYIISFANSWGMSKWENVVNGKAYGVTSNPLWMLALAVAIFPFYYFSFYYTIKWMDIKTPGRDDEPVNVQPMTSKEATKGKGGQKTAKGGDKYAIMAEKLVALIGYDNITKVDNCASRLRLNVKDSSVGTDQEYKAIGTYGVRRLGKEGLQIVIGTDVQFVADQMHEITGK